jgi:hypothetical protein
MPANVYLFNLYSEPISNLTIDGCPAGSIAGYGNGGGTPIYTPASLAVPRTRYPSGSAEFALGANIVVLPWDSFRGTVTVTIPDPAQSPVGLNDPLLLLLAVNSAMLLSTRGQLLSSFPVQLAMQAAAAEPA